MNNLFFIQFYSLMVAFPAALAYMDFFYYLATDKRLFRWGAFSLELFILGLPTLLLYNCDTGDSYGNNTIIYPLYRPVIYSLILLCLLTYFYVVWRKKLTHPLLEVIINCSLLLGVAVNILIVARMQDPSALFAINLPATLFLILALVRNHRLLLYTLEDDYVDVLEPAPWGRPNQDAGVVAKACWGLLQLRPVLKTVVLVVLSLPAVIQLTKMLLFTGGTPNH